MISDERRKQAIGWIPRTCARCGNTFHGENPAQILCCYESPTPRTSDEEKLLIGVDLSLGDYPAMTVARRLSDGGVEIIACATGDKCVEDVIHQVFAHARRAQAAESKCGLCLPDKPCNHERCPNDTVLAADYNAKVAEIERLGKLVDEWVTIQDKTARKNKELRNLLEKAKVIVLHAHLNGLETKAALWFSDYEKLRGDK